MAVAPHRQKHVGGVGIRDLNDGAKIGSSRTMQESLPQARRYARRFLAYAELHREFINDRFADVSSLRSMAQEVRGRPQTHTHSCLTESMP